jgi:hypothetical protein
VCTVWWISHAIILAANGVAGVVEKAAEQHQQLPPQRLHQVSLSDAAQSSGGDGAPMLSLASADMPEAAPASCFTDTQLQQQLHSTLYSNSLASNANTASSTTASAAAAAKTSFLEVLASAKAGEASRIIHTYRLPR